ncbi:hypothetical protein AB0L13_33820 [Saccharopolyspora shandongensis]|uniref:hypothetical protein n=1 Tax=Saccharopolyspora shandongensis TaxID=418495 RepID=UPI0034376F98
MATTWSVSSVVRTRSRARRAPPDSGGSDRQRLMLDNDVVVSSVNANLRHYNQAVQALAAADRNWLESLISRRIPLRHWTDVFDTGPDEVNVVVDLLTPAP